ncbi:MAG: type II toxin-antitoxin system VapC family toxin [Acidimicrobiia bacterium]
MTTYVDSSALLKRYVSEPDSEFAISLIDADEVLATSWLTVVEVRRALSQLLHGNELTSALQVVHDDIERMAMVLPDAITWQSAADIAATLSVRSLDAVHLACAQRLRIPSLRFVTFDVRQAVAGRALGFAVLGA